GHAHSGLMIYNGTNWPPEYRGDAFTVNLHGHRINRDALELASTSPLSPSGGEGPGVRGAQRAGFVAKHRPDFAKTTDPWFRGIDLLCGPDGGVYIADWSDVGECHENDGVHRSSGRIFKLTWGAISQARDKSKKAPPALIPDMVTTPPEQLVEFAVKFNNEWLARQARIRILELADSGTAEQKRRLKVHVSGLGDLRSTFACPDPKTVASEDSSILVSTNTGLRSVWCERLLGMDDDARLLDVLSRGDPRGQSWAIRIMAERGLNDKTSAAVAQSASSSSSGLVLLHLASALQRLPHDARWPIANALASRGEFAGDPVLPLMVWYGIEPAVPADPDKAVALAESTKMPKLRTFIARRLTHLLTQQPEAANKVVELLGRLGSTESQLNVLTGMKDALAGMRKAPPPTAWARVAAKLSQTSEVSKTSEVSGRERELVRQAVREVSVVFGDGRAIDEVKKIAAARGSDSESRRQAIRSLVEARAAGLAPLLQGLLDDRDIGPDVIRGLAAISDAGTPRLLLDNYKRLLPPARSEAINTLVSRPAFASPLLDAVAAGSVQRMHVSSFQLRQMQSFGDEQITKRIADLWPELRAISAEKTKKIADYKTTLTPERLATANLPVGRKLFEKSCMSCHILFGQGGKAGPELTGAQRNNLAYLLENIVDPSLTVSANFKMSIVVLTDGRVLNGVVAGKSDQTLTLQTPTERLVLPLGDIEEQRESNLSLMPEGQLDVLKPDDVRDLIGYLMSPQQVALDVSP
ncbi:MAG: c-type cytochrome, partial [Planctomycetales bacterium]|nr:c-type cytochrome [Planctomycetales bacterium]